jgi:hypothetical protein
VCHARKSPPHQEKSTAQEICTAFGTQALSRRKPDAVIEPSGKAIFAAKSKRSGADGSIVSSIGGPTLLFDIKNSPFSKSHRSRVAPTN